MAQTEIGEYIVNAHALYVPVGGELLIKRPLGSEIGRGNIAASHND